MSVGCLVNHVALGAMFPAALQVPLESTNTVTHQLAHRALFRVWNSKAVADDPQSVGLKILRERPREDFLQGTGREARVIPATG